MIRAGTIGFVFAAGLCAQPTEKSILVKFGEPQIWSLDQAHYLLEQRFQRNHTLEATRPTADELNANAVNGSKLSAVRTLIQAGGTFDEGVGLTNQLAQRRITEDLNLRQDRTQQLQASFVEQARLAAEIDAIAQPASNYYTKPDGTKDMNPDAKARTVALGLALDTEKRRGEVIKTSLADSVPTQLQKAEPPEKVPLGSMASDILKDKFAFGDPKLAASNAVDNYVNLQNEMIMKQVTLLRNEAGYNRRIVFAELPQAFEVEGLRWYRHASENQLVQVQWRLDGFLYVNTQREKSTVAESDQAEPFKRRDLLEATVRKMSGFATSALVQQYAMFKNEVQFPGILKDTCYGAVTSTEYGAKTTATTRSTSGQPTMRDCSTHTALPVSMPPGTLRTLELVPRQSSLNINDRNYANTAVNLYGLFRLLSGIGVNVGFQRQKEAYEQYITQEVYATSYGKGSNEFGWIFGANPGNRTVMPGQRTTYAVFSVPANAISIVLQARACVFDRRDRLDPAKDCEMIGESPVWQQFVVPVPSEFDSAFWVEEARYSPSIAGTRKMVYLSGKHFSNLTGVTINGVPLRRAVSIATPDLSPPSSAANGDAGIAGEYELIGSQQLVMAFRMPLGFVGTPRIGLITPVKARELNELTLKVVQAGGRRYTNVKLNAPEVFPMFYGRPEIRSVRAEGPQLHVEGGGLPLLDQYSASPWARYFWNDELVRLIRPVGVGLVTSGDSLAERIVLEIDPGRIRSGSRVDLRVEFYPEFGVPNVRFVAANPAELSIVKASIVKFIPAVAADRAHGVAPQPASALLEIDGSSLGTAMNIALEYNDGRHENVTARLTSEGNLLARISPPAGGGFALFTITDPVAPSRITSSSVVIPAPPAKQAPDFEETERTIKQVPVKK